MAQLELLSHIFPNSASPSVSHFLFSGVRQMFSLWTMNSDVTPAKTSYMNLCEITSYMTLGSWMVWTWSVLKNSMLSYHHPLSRITGPLACSASIAVTVFTWKAVSRRWLPIGMSISIGGDAKAHKRHFLKISKSGLNERGQHRTTAGPRFTTIRNTKFHSY